MVLFLIWEERPLLSLWSSSFLTPVLNKSLSLSLNGLLLRFFLVGSQEPSWWWAWGPPCQCLAGQAAIPPVLPLLPSPLLLLLLLLLLLWPLLVKPSTQGSCLLHRLYSRRVLGTEWIFIARSAAWVHVSISLLAKHPSVIPKHYLCVLVCHLCNCSFQYSLGPWITFVLLDFFYNLFITSVPWMENPAP